MKTKWRRPRPPGDDGPRPLVFAPLAWLKLQFLCHAGPTEVAAFGLSSRHDPLYLLDVLVVKQKTSLITVAFDDGAVADLFDRMADSGISPNRFARVWVHTHPGASVEPSGTDEATFARVFGACDWAVMAILGRTGNTSARLRFTSGPGGNIDLPVVVDWESWPREAADPIEPLWDRVATWEHEYATLVEPERIHAPTSVPATEVLFDPFFPGGADVFA